MKIKKRSIFILLSVGILQAAGCGGGTDQSGQCGQDELLTEHLISVDSANSDLHTDNNGLPLWENGDSGRMPYSDIIAEQYQEIYHTVVKPDVTVTDDTESTRIIADVIQRLGEQGYTAIDSKNQINMTKKEQVLQFYEAVEQKAESGLTIFVVAAPTRFTRYELTTANGEVVVTKGIYQYNNECFEKINEISYVADSWQYTKEGYFIFTGSSYSEESYMLTMSDVPEITALRVEPLEERCKEYNECYISLIGYGRNNIFLCDWSEEDYGNLDFYDVFERFYPMYYQQPFPYVADENISVGTVYLIPEEEFESVIGMHFSIDREALRSKAKYLPESRAYEYRPRGFYDAESPSIPYPEVVNYVSHADGTITLTVNAVYPSEGTSKAYTHEVVVCPQGQDEFQYVSNMVLHSKDDYEMDWHTERLTEEEWEKIYGQ